MKGYDRSRPGLRFRAHGLRARRRVVWIAACLMSLAAVGVGIYFLVVESGGHGATAGSGSDGVVSLYPVHVGDTWGYIDPTGKMVIQPQFAMAGDFSEGLAAVAVAVADGAQTTTTAGAGAGTDDRTVFSISGMNDIEEPSAGPRWLWGFIDQSGKLVIAPRFTDVHAFSDGLVMVWSDGFHGFVDRNGREVIDLRDYPDARDFSEGLAAVMCLVGDQGYYGYIDRTGRLVIPNEFTDAGDFSEGLATVCEAGYYGYIDAAGDWAIQPAYESAGPFSEGLAAVGVDTKKGVFYGYIDTSGALVIPARYSCAEDFHEGLAAAAPLDDGRVVVPITLGFIDKTGAMVIPPKFNFSEGFSQGLAVVALVRQPDSSGILGLPGTPAEYSGLGYIDKTGSFAILPRFGGFSGSFTPGGLARVNLDNSGRLMRHLGDPDPPWAYIDTTGKIVWQSR